jgi:hypothetical protein
MEYEVSMGSVSIDLELFRLFVTAPDIGSTRLSNLALIRRLNRSLPSAHALFVVSRI